MLFEDRYEAGRFLASRLLEIRDRADGTVLALPRGGVPVGYEVARTLHASLDIFVVRKLGVPGQEELAMGALSSGGITVLNHRVIEALEIPQQVIHDVVAKEEHEIERREREYRDSRPPIDVRSQIVILVDDGLATGSSMRVAAIALRKKSPAQIVMGVPVAAAATCAEFENQVDRVVCAITPEPFWAVGQWYRDFSQTSDEEVRELLRRAAEFTPRRAA